MMNHKLVVEMFVISIGECGERHWRMSYLTHTQLSSRAQCEVILQLSAIMQIPCALGKYSGGQYL